jgi:NADH-quinone oxidoreductase subunit N
MFPIVLLSVFAVVLLFLGFLKSRSVLLPATLLFLVAALVVNFLDWNKTYLYFNGMLRTDNLSMVFTAITLVSSFLVVALSGSFAEEEAAQPAEYYAIILFSLVGAVMMIGYENLIMLFVGVEILSVAMYVLTGSDKRNLRSNEAALKYFLMGAFATGIMLFGMALLYGASGSFTLAGIASYASHAQQGLSLIFYVGLLMLLIGLLFKVSAAPFHFWTPDVYDGAPTIFTAYMSTVVKTAGFAALLHLLAVSFTGIYSFWSIILAVITAITLIAGNVTAVYQDSFKRMMAYSSISHAGYLLIGLAALGAQSRQAIVFYSLAYSVATISAFGVLLLVARQRSMQTLSSNSTSNESFDAFNGLAKQNPLLGLAMATSMLSLAGIPLTAGFWGKFYMFSTAVAHGQIWLLVVAVLMSAVGIYYYFRVIIAMYFRDGATEPIRVSPVFQYVLVATIILTIGLGVAPGLLQGLF